MRKLKKLRWTPILVGALLAVSILQNVAVIDNKAVAAREPEASADQPYVSLSRQSSQEDMSQHIGSVPMLEDQHLNQRYGQDPAHILLVTAVLGLTAAVLALITECLKLMQR